MYYLAFSKKSLEDLRSLKPAGIERIRRALIILAQDPLKYALPLEEPWEKIWVYESQPFNIYFRIYEKEEVAVVAGVRINLLGV